MTEILNCIALGCNVVTLLILLRLIFMNINRDKDIATLFYVTKSLVEINEELIKAQEEMGEAIKYIHKKGKNND